MLHTRKKRKKDFYRSIREDQKKRKKEYLQFGELLRERTGLPADLSGNSIITVLGKHLCIIKNHEQIQFYHPNEIRLRMKNGSYCITGTNLMIVYSAERELRVEGNITGILFS